MPAPWSPMIAPPLVCRNDLEFNTDPDGWAEEACIRVSGEIECPVCGMAYWRHISVAKEAPTLVRACDGRLLKL